MDPLLDVGDIGKHFNHRQAGETEVENLYAEEWQNVHSSVLLKKKKGTSGKSLQMVLTMK